MCDFYGPIYSRIFAVFVAYLIQFYKYYFQIFSLKKFSFLKKNSLYFSKILVIVFLYSFTSKKTTHFFSHIFFVFSFVFYLKTISLLTVKFKFAKNIKIKFF